MFSTQDWRQLRDVGFEEVVRKLPVKAASSGELWHSPGCSQAQPNQSVQTTIGNIDRAHWCLEKTAAGRNARTALNVATTAEKLRAFRAPNVLTVRAHHQAVASLVDLDRLEHNLVVCASVPQIEELRLNLGERLGGEQDRGHAYITSTEARELALLALGLEHIEKRWYRYDVPGRTNSQVVDKWLSARVDLGPDAGAEVLSRSPDADSASALEGILTDFIAGTPHLVVAGTSVPIRGAIGTAWEYLHYGPLKVRRAGHYELLVVPSKVLEMMEGDDTVAVYSSAAIAGDTPEVVDTAIKLWEPGSEAYSGADDTLQAARRL